MAKETLTVRVREALLKGTISDWQHYHNLIGKYVTPESTVLDIGCGKGDISPFPWSETPHRHLIGIDPDPAAKENAVIDEFHHLDVAADWPVEDKSVDIAISRYVLEHVADVEFFFANLRRVLRPGGTFIFLTPNKYNPFMAMSRLLPMSLKRKILSSTADQIDEDDVFPVCYRLNSRGAIRKAAREEGFTVDELYCRDHRPLGYFNFSLITFLPAYLFHLIAKGLFLDRIFGASLSGVLKKTGD